MTVSPVTAPALYTGDPTKIFKGTFTVVLLQDYSPSSVAARVAAASPQTIIGAGGVTSTVQMWTPIDSATGLLIGNLKTALSAGGVGFQTDMGGFTEDGLEFDRSNTMATDKWAQSPDIMREDVSERTAGFTLTAGQLSPFVDRIDAMLPLTGTPSYGTAGTMYLPEASPTSYEYEALLIAVDKKFGIVNRCIWFPRVTATKPDKQSYKRKASVTPKLTFDAMPDPSVLAPYVIFMDGPGYRAGGGVTAVPGGTTAPVAAVVGSSGGASLTFAPPTSPNSPFTYSVFATVSGTTTQVPSDDVSVDASTTSTSVKLDITGLAAGATTFQVSATGANLATSSLSLASNSVTIVG